jgi:hypothetical protein
MGDFAAVFGVGVNASEVHALDPPALLTPLWCPLEKVRPELGEASYEERMSEVTDTSETAVYTVLAVLAVLVLSVELLALVMLPILLVLAILAIVPDRESELDAEGKNAVWWLEEVSARCAGRVGA